MIEKLPPGMDEAARLVRLGKLAEATAYIQRLLNRQRSPGAKAGRPSVLAGSAEVDADRAPAGSHPKPQVSLPAGTRPRAGLRETLTRLAAMAKAAKAEFGTQRRTAPEPLPERASFKQFSYSNAAGTRNFKLYVPAGARDKPAPLIVMLHGCTQSPDDFAAGTQMNALAEEHGFLAVYPEQSANANLQRCWNWFNPEDQQRDRGELSLIAGITRQIIRDYNADPERVYIAGLSAGGAAAALMGEAYPDLYAGIGVHSGLPSRAASNLASALNAMRTGAPAQERHGRIVPTIVFHGDKDAVVHPSNGFAVTAQALGPGSALRLTVQEGRAEGGHGYRRSIYADGDGRAICEQWEIVGGGHAWAGGSPSGTYTDPLGPDASKEMVRFFEAHRLNS